MIRASIACEAESAPSFSARAISPIVSAWRCIVAASGTYLARSRSSEAPRLSLALPPRPIVLLSVSRLGFAAFAAAPIPSTAAFVSAAPALAPAASMLAEILTR
ncbi:hypothetical protein [Ensifer soli]|uniref:hypothetical protein n=1 Tax=Ciceribacter sp. sgz301302 TaxID=3342379 RepID=UPI0035B87652